MSDGQVVLLRSEAGRSLLQSKCNEEGLDVGVLKQLVSVELDQQGKLKKRGITESFDEIFDNIGAESGE